MKYKSQVLLLALCIGVVFLPFDIAMASVEGSLNAIRDVLVNRIFPVVAMIGLVFAGFSFVSGNPNARSHLFYAIAGAAIAFGARSIIALVQSVVN